MVIIAVYSYFCCEVLASQFLEVPKKAGEPVVDFVVPIFSLFYFLFLMGWLKVSIPPPYSYTHELLIISLKKLGGHLG